MIFFFFTKGPHISVLKVALMRSLVGTSDQNIAAGRQEWLGGAGGWGRELSERGDWSLSHRVFFYDGKV